ncbi:MAG: hypothetical protein IJM14_04775 [Lachnospiraceae bacterium]|nr:hypothetical protein [Lachnospiraceae bacterium]
MPKKKQQYYPVDRGDAYTDEELEKLSNVYMVSQYDMGFMLGIVDPEVKKEFDGWMGDVQMGRENEGVGEPIDEVPSPVPSACMPSFKLGFTDQEIERGNQVFKKSSDAMKKYLINIDDEHKPFYSNVKLITGINDSEKTNTFKLLSEDSLLANIRSQAVGASPDVFLTDVAELSENKRTLKPEHVEKWLKENDIQRPLMGFFDAANDILETEIKKDKDKRVNKNWSSEKEKIYLANLEDAYTRLIDTFDELRKVPHDIALNKDYFGNNLSHLTGVEAGETRDAHAQMGIAKLKRDAIRQGWSSDGLDALQGLGYFAGRIEKEIYQAELKGESKKLADLTAWKEKNLDPIMQDISGTKITKASDMLSQIEKIEAFDEKIKDDPLVRNYYEDTLGANKAYMVPKSKNSVLDAMDREKVLGKPQIGIDGKYLKKADYTDSMKTLLDTIKTMDNPEMAKGVAAAYIVDRYLDGKSLTGDGDLFSTKRYGYKDKIKQLQKEAEKYAAEITEKLKPVNGKELATLLEFGDHSNAFSIMKDRVKAAGEKSVYNDFIKGSLSDPGSQKTITQVAAQMKKADEGVVSFNSRFGDVMKALPKLDTARKELAGMVKKSYAEGKPIDFESKTFKRFEKKCIENYNKMKSYLADKEKLIREKGGDPKKPEDAALLGVNGAKRYLAMKEAGGHITDLVKLTRRLKETPPTEFTKQTLAKNDLKYAGTAENYMAEVYRNQFRKEKTKLREAGINEAELRKNIKAEYEKGAKTEKDKKAFEQKMVDSCTRSLHADTVMSLYEDKLKNLLDNPGDKELRKNVDKLFKEYKQAVNETVVMKDGKPVINAQSEQLGKFKNGVLAEGDPFKKEFADAVIKTAEKGSVMPGQIRTLRDNALVNCLQKANGKEEEQKYEKLSSAFGSKSVESFKKALDNKMKTDAVKKAAELKSKQAGGMTKK